MGKGKDVYAYFVAKFDTSGSELANVSKKYGKLWRRIWASGMDMYCIDYTQDFSGTLDQTAMVEHLLANEYRMQDSWDDMEESLSTILDNISSVGNNVCTFLPKYGDETVRCKYHNKIVSNFEAGEVREKFGGHLAEYIACPHERKRNTFLHPNVQERELCRL